MMSKAARRSEYTKTRMTDKRKETISNDNQARPQQPNVALTTMSVELGGDVGSVDARLPLQLAEGVVGDAIAAAHRLATEAGTVGGAAAAEGQTGGHAPASKRTLHVPTRVRRL